MNVIIFGNVPLTSWVAEQVLKSSKLNLLGVVCEDFAENHFAHHGLPYPSASFYTQTECIKRLTFEEAEEHARSTTVLGLSVRFNVLFKKSFYELFKPGIINLHGGDLPRYRGTNIANHAILEGAEKGAGTLHFIDEGVDTGDIVIRTFFKVERQETAYSFFRKTLNSLQKAFKEFLNCVEETGRIEAIPQRKLIEEGEEAKEYRHRDLLGKSEISHEEIGTPIFDRKVRAFSFPKHEPAFINYHGRKYHVLCNFDEVVGPK